MKVNLSVAKYTAHSITRRLMVVQTLAGLSQWIDIFLIFSIPAFLWDFKPSQIASIALCFGLPGLLFGPFIGVLLDHTDSKTAAFFGSVVRTVLTAFIALVNSYEIFVLLVFLKGLANAFYWPATAILTNRVVEQPQRIKYYSGLSALDQVTKIMTPLIAGAATLLVSLQFVFFISVLATLICALLIASLPSFQEAVRTEDRGTFSTVLKELVAGLRIVRLLPSGLITSIFLGLGLSFCLAIYDPHIAAFLNATGLNASTYSYLLSATGFGAVFGALLVRFQLGKWSPDTLMLAGLFLFFLAITTAAFLTLQTPAIAVRHLVVIWFINGLGYELFAIGSSVNMQNLCPPKFLGRITTSMRSFQMMAVIGGPSFGAWLIVHHTRSTPFLFSAALAFILLSACVVGQKRGKALQC